jgi:hypothetical protein
MRNLQVWVSNDTNHLDNLDYDYDLIINDSTTEMQLLYSKSSEWSNPNETNASLSDHGNGIDIVLSRRKQMLKLDYAQAQELLVLLAMHQDAKIEIRKSTTIKTID